MYSINNIPIRNYGMVPGRAPGSNIAVEGVLDLFRRIGKVYHDWGEEDGVEPYVAPTDHFNYEYGKFIFHTIVTGKTRADVVRRMEDLYREIGVLETFDLQTPFGNFRGYVKEKITVDWIGPAAAKVRMTFDGYIVSALVDYRRSPSDIGLHHIDNISLVDYGAYVIKVEDNFDRPETKEAFSSEYFRNYQITRPGYKEFQLTLVFKAKSYLLMSGAIASFYSELLEPGTRVMNVDGLERECFNFEGTKVTDIRVMPGLAVCEMTLPMALAFDGIPNDRKYLLDDEDTAIANDATTFIGVQEPNILELADNQGRLIRNNDFETITK